METILKNLAFVPFSGLIGEPLVNVLEGNMELDRLLPGSIRAGGAMKGPNMLSATECERDLDCDDANDGNELPLAWEGRVFLVALVGSIPGHSSSGASWR